MTYQILFKGIVQGVGFRPLVYAIAKKNRIKGFVRNTTKGVELLVNVLNKNQAQSLLENITKNAPRRSVIVETILRETDPISFTDFTIQVDTSSVNSTTMISPDFSLCSDCRDEVQDHKNKRFQYPFITCTHCGPRYSIMESLPYQRQFTSMKNFILCESCNEEYFSVSNKRFYAETNSCATCGIKMVLQLQNGKHYYGNEVLPMSNKVLRDGKILAVKGIGGYLLLCDSTAESVLQLLRLRKHRNTKPFAVMYKNIASLKLDFDLSPAEEEAILSFVSPIVLLSVKKNPTSGIQLAGVAPHINTVGVMLPCAPLLQLIANDFNKPLVATSANISRSPIIYLDDDAQKELISIADAVLIHDRAIVMPQDDSVFRFTKFNRKIILRRSRGMAPSYFHTNTVKGKTLLGMGAMMKSTATLVHQNNYYVSQYIGDLSNFDTYCNYQKIINHLLQITSATPEIILIDKHPDYFSTQEGTKISSSNKLPLYEVQHHFAHFAAVIAENNLYNQNEVIGGVIWDGIGLGLDKVSWGGEFFTWNRGTEMKRIAHLKPFPVIMGDKMAQEPRLSALSLLVNNANYLANKFTNTEFKIYLKSAQNPTHYTTSMGRVFDAVASLCGLCDKNSYEGEAALYLENIATKYASKAIQGERGYPFTIVNNQLDVQSLIELIKNSVVKNEPIEQIGYRFHVTLVKMIEEIALTNGLKKISFSGGVFQNALLVQLIEEQLKTNFDLYFHHQLSPNDECISFGQVVYWQLMNESFIQKK